MSGRAKKLKKMAMQVWLGEPAVRVKFGRFETYYRWTKKLWKKHGRSLLTN